jgi:hypothetical protein
VVRNDIQRIDGLSSLDEMDLDGQRYLYHYTRAETAIKYMLPDRRLRMSPHTEVNDPRESKQWFFSVVAPKGSILPGKSIDIGRTISEYMRSRARVLCFCGDGFPLRCDFRDVDLRNTTGWRHPNMWAHYGENHRGVVLAFDRKKLLTSAIATLRNRADLRYGHILYVSSDHPAGMHPEIIDYNDWASRSPNDSASRHLDRYRGWFFFTKHDAWAAERECRLVAFGELNRYEYVEFGDALVEIVLGEAASTETVVACERIGKDLGVPISRVFWRNGTASRVPLA